ncbi:MAG TPA: family 10 glycosylhydrolase [Saprospiraceae bacterium]|nr:family 10 glycosylhydrolase [Saprospiraceae bacterium]HMP12442.1 family 10 glycosylhydrolase [Saprospiraceae bacterium]
MRIHLLLIALIYSFMELPAQDLLPKREFRAAWVATVANIDYPRQGTPNAIAHQEQWKKLLEQYKSMGLNAVIVQVRPAADALYPSDLAPWSRYLTGKQGSAPEPMYDPLKFMIDESHKMGFEFHAWFNPYRATVDLDTISLAPNHAFRLHRNWMVRYGTRFYFNPALPQVRQHVVDVVTEVVEKYDVDAIHFDDYFYPYKIQGEDFPDSLDYYRYGSRFSSIEDWRRSNVDSLIERVHTRIRDIKPHVQFGISPFGVWRNKDKDPTGSNTRAGATCYDDLYADILKWLRLGWIDYVIPQLYWNIGFPPADHATLLNWWSTRSFERNLYIGHAAYKVQNNPEAAWSDPNETPRQIQLNRRNPVSKGSAYFSSRSLIDNRLGLRDSLAVYYQMPALLPIPPDATLKAPEAPRLGWTYYKKRSGEVKLRWRFAKADKAAPPAYYVVYRFYSTKIGNLEDPEEILHITPFFEKKKRFSYTDQPGATGNNYTYTVTAVNRQHIESRPAKARTIKTPRLNQTSDYILP